MSFFQSWKTWGSLLLMFVAGVLVGGLGTVRVVQKIAQERKNSERWTPRAMAWLDREIKLTTEQKTKIEPIVGKSMTDLRKLRDESEETVRMIFASMFLELASELDESQRDQLRTKLQKLRDNVGAERHHHSPGTKP
jgi:hypothetical protein